MKRILIVLLVVMSLSMLHAQVREDLWREDFEAANAAANWTLNPHQGRANQWFVGSPAIPDGAVSPGVNATRYLYISNDGGTTNSWGTGAGGSYAFRTIDLPEYAADVQLSFRIRLRGTTMSGAVRVYLVPADVNIPANTMNWSAPTVANLNTGDALREWLLPLGNAHWGSATAPEAVRRHFRQTNGWITVNHNLPQVYNGRNITEGVWRLVFMFVSTSSAVSGQPAAGIDDVSITYLRPPVFPLPADLVGPRNGATMTFRYPTLMWAPHPSGVRPTGYRLVLRTAAEELFNESVGNVTSWSSETMFEPGTQYFWQVLPYNDDGYADPVPEWSFTTGVGGQVFVGTDETSGSGVMLPWSTMHEDSRSQTIYYPHELVPAGYLITHISYDNSGHTAGFADEIVISMGLTFVNTFANTTSWIPETALTEVFRGFVETAGIDRHWIDIPITHFPYDGESNLIVQVRRLSGNSRMDNSFHSTSTPDVNRSIVERTGLGTVLRSAFPNTRLRYSAPEIGPVIFVGTSSINFGTVIYGSTVQRTITIENRGTEELEIDITLPEGLEMNVPDETLIVNARSRRDVTFTLLTDSPGPVAGNIILESNTIDGEDVVISVTALIRDNLVQIGTGTLSDVSTGTGMARRSQFLPWHLHTQCSYSQTIYLSSEIDRANGDLITAIYYQYNGEGAMSCQIQIFMGYTNRTAFTANSWIAHSELTEVFEGTVQSVAGNADINWTRIVLDTPFPFRDDQNLVIAVNNRRNVALSPTANRNSFINMQTPTNRSIYRIHTSAINPASPGSGTQHNQIPNTRLGFGNNVNGPFIMVPTSVVDFGRVMQGRDSAVGTVTIRNFGTADLDATIVTPEFVTSNLASVIIPPREARDVTFRINASRVGVYDGNIYIESESNNNRSVSVRANAYIVEAPQAGYAQVGIGDIANDHNIPWEPRMPYSYTQTIYLASELGIPANYVIRELLFQYRGEPTLTDEIRVYLGHTELDRFADADSWIDYADLELAFSGPFPLPDNPEVEWIEILFDVDFLYTGGNLVVVVHKDAGSITAAATHDFMQDSTDGNRTLTIRSDNLATEIDPEAPGTGTLRAFIPNTRFAYERPGHPRPRGLTGVGGDNLITLYWQVPVITGDGALTVVKYLVYRNDRIIGTVYATEELTFLDDTVINGVTYFYHIVAVYSDDGESAGSNILEISPTGTVLNPPIIMGPASVDRDNVNIGWTVGRVLMNESFESRDLRADWTNRGFETVFEGSRDGNQHMASRSRDDDGEALEQDNWLITHPITITSAIAFLNYWVGAADSENYAEEYSVLVSRNAGTAVGDFELEPLLRETLTTNAWVARSISLGQFNGQTIRLAFVHNTEVAESALWLDGIQILVPPSGRNVPNVTSFEIYRNGVYVTTVPGMSFGESVTTAGEYEYFVVAVYSNGFRSTRSNVVRATVVTVSEAEETVLPMATQLRGNFPNPFNPETLISFDLANDSPVLIEIYNVRGQRVRTLVNEDLTAGRHSVLWDGNDSSGRGVSSGVYFYRMNAGEVTSTRRMVLLK